MVMPYPRFIMVGLVLGVLSLVVPSVSWAKYGGPLRVVTPAGGVRTIRGSDARAWENDYWTWRRGDCSCRSPESSARFAGRVAARWGEHPPVPWLIIPRQGLPSLYYPATKSAPAYVVTPGALTNSYQAAAATWSAWQVPSPLMKRILADATGSSGSSPTTYFMVGGAIAAVIVLVAIAVAVLRRRVAHRRLRPLTN